VTQLTERDLELLALLGEHRFLLAAHVQAWLGASRRTAAGRLRALGAAGMLERRQEFHRHPACYMITRRGLGAIGSPLPTPRLDLSTYRHDFATAWLCLAAREGVWGPVREVITERTLRSSDATRRGIGGARGPDPEPLLEPHELHGVRLGGFDRHGRPRLHYPDLIVVTGEGRRIAVELELTSKSRTRLEGILAGYGADPSVDGVLYLVDRPGVGRAIAAAAHRVGVEDLVRVQSVRWSAEAPRDPRSRASQRSPRTAGRER
jgi:hypothetical protein